MSCKYKSYSLFFSKKKKKKKKKKNSIYAIFNDQSFNDSLTNDIVSFEQLGPGVWSFGVLFCPNDLNVSLATIVIITQT